jgi:hypothetical protein
MNPYPPAIEKADETTRRKQALAKVYSLLMKLAEEKETKTADVLNEQETTAPLKSNIPPGQ